MPTFGAEALRQLTVTIFERLSTPTDTAQCVADHLVEANLAGHDSHGVLRVPQYVQMIADGDINPAGTLQVVTRGATTAVVEGQYGFGQLIGRDATRMAMSMARETGCGSVAARWLAHTGRIGTYTEMAAREGLVALAFVNSGGAGQLVAPFGGIERRLSTNPISIAAPWPGEFPLVLDMSTSVAPEGKVRARHLHDKRAPEGWIIDSAGQPTTNTDDFYAGGAILPLGGAAGHKGFALGLMIDILAGALSSAGCAQKPPPRAGDGLLIVVLDVERFAPLGDFQQRITDLIAYVKTPPTLPGTDHILAPGEPEAIARRRRLQEGIQLTPALWEQIESICRRLNVPLPV